MPARLFVFRCRAALNPSSYPRGKVGIRVWLLRTVFMRRTEVSCMKIVSPPGAVRCPGLRKVPLVAKGTSLPLAGGNRFPREDKLRVQICAPSN